jgi:hypothetical protein
MMTAYTRCQVTDPKPAASSRRPARRLVRALPDLPKTSVGTSHPEN